MDNFDLKKYLVENKVTTNSKMMKENEQPVKLLKVLTNYSGGFVNLTQFNKAKDDDFYSDFSGLDGEYDSVEEMLDAIRQYNEEAGRDEEIVAVKSTAGEFNT